MNELLVAGVCAAVLLVLARGFDAWLAHVESLRQDARRHADVDQLARQSLETRTNRVWTNVPSSGDEHEVHLGI